MLPTEFAQYFLRMASRVHFYFKNAPRNWDSVMFSGLDIPMQELKMEIVKKALAGQMEGFDLRIFNATTKKGRYMHLSLK